ncbi:hypothetical protein GCM10009085_32390 [Pseudomonas avellanae]|nr:hypothetical protein GCM10009085_32390 [Pseudomonas avellanae]
MGSSACRERPAFCWLACRACRNAAGALKYQAGKLLLMNPVFGWSDSKGAESSGGVGGKEAGAACVSGGVRTIDMVDTGNSFVKSQHDKDPTTCR